MPPLADPARRLTAPRAAVPPPGRYRLLQRRRSPIPPRGTAERSQRTTGA
jgi:hypothetical protein